MNASEPHDARMPHERRQASESLHRGGPVAQVGPFLLTSCCHRVPHRDALKIDVKVTLAEGLYTRAVARRIIPDIRRHLGRGRGGGAIA